MSRKMSNRKYAEALYDVSKGLKSEKLSEALKVFVEILVKNNKLKKAGKILEEFIKYSKKQSGEVAIEITSAHELDTHTLVHIKKAFGEKVESVEKVDKSLLGGVKVKLEDKILDGSVRTQLRKLKQSLI